MRRMKNLLKVATGTVVALGVMSASAFANNTGNIEFSGEVTDSCTLVVSDATGVLNISDNYKTLTSVGGTESSGNVKMTTNVATAKLSVKKPDAWDTQPVEYTEATKFTAAFQFNDDANKTLHTAAQEIGLIGSRSAKIHLTATAQNDALFVAGDYAATVVVTCD